MGQVIYHFAFLHFSLVIGLRCHWATLSLGMGQVIYHFAFLHFSLVIGLRCHWAWGTGSVGTRD
jgi:hypothetical protein